MEEVEIIRWMLQLWLGLQVCRWLGDGGLQRLWRRLRPGRPAQMRRRCGPRSRPAICPTRGLQRPVPPARPDERPAAAAKPVRKMQLRKRH